MNIVKDYRNFALSKGLGSSQIDSQEKQQVSNLAGTPMILEERQMNVAPFDVFSRLMYDRIIFLSGEVTSDSMDTIVAQLLYLDSVDNRDINIYINSPGGDCYSGLELCSTMDFIKSNVRTTVLGMAASMGSVLLCAGAKGKRSALQHSRVLIHQPLGGAQGQAADILIAAKEIDKTRTELYKIISEHSGQPYEKVFADADRDFWMTSEEALEYGMVDEILKGKSGK